MKFRFLILLTPFAFISCKHGELDNSTIRNQARQLMSDTSYSYIPKEGFVSNEEIAVQIAEPVLFNIYGKDKIKDERPYQVNLIDSVWVINGTLPLYKLGGTFWIIINKKDGRILRVIHDK